MSWIESHTTLTRNPKFRKFIRRLNIDISQGVGHLTFLWHNVMEQAEDGDITKWSIEDIAEYADWREDPKRFYEALLDGWIDKNPKIILIHDWLERAGRYLTTKYRISNPNKLKQIYKKHKTVFSQSKVSQKTDNIDNQHNIHNLLYSPNSLELKLSQLLLEIILKRKPDFKKPDLQKWGSHINRMIYIDKRNPDEIEKVMLWCQQDDFWQNNILSTEKLRKQYDQLVLKMNKPQKGQLSIKADKIILDQLNKMATKDMVIKVLKELPEQYWSKVRSFLIRRYSDGEKVFGVAEVEIKRND